MKISEMHIHAFSRIRLELELTINNLVSSNSNLKIKVWLGLNIKLKQVLNQTFHYTRRITPKRVTSLRCPSPRHSAKAA